MIRRIVFGLAVAASAWQPALAQSHEPIAPGSDQVQIVTFPHQADLWDAALSPDGRLHVVYSVKAVGQGRRGASSLFYVATRDASGEHWLDPRPVPTGELPATVGGERQPLIAVMPHDVVLVAWPSGGMIGAARSADNGGSWVAVSPRDANAPGHADTMTMGASPGGRVAFAWTDTAVMGRGGDELAAPLHVAISTNSGATYAAPTAINTDLPGACVCCTPDVAFDDSGNLWVAYRTSSENIKEICVARVGLDGAVTGVIVSRDEWHLKGCPMNGPELAVSGDGGKVSVTWTREALIRGATSSDGGRQFGQVFDLGAGRMHNGAARGGALRINWESGGGLIVADPAQREQQQALRVSRGATMQVTADGRTLLVTAAAKDESPAPEEPHH
ncbi:MAG: exo-alpha-sialidase [Phycisphaerales bacterium]|nr:exo-alpha-sialidase [Phycisphaerales bacterium]